MSDCNKVFSYIYSSPSLDAARDLVNVFLKTFEIRDLTADDMFYFGVFCAPSTYTQFTDWDNVDFDVPEQLTNPCVSGACQYVVSIIEKVTKGEIEKPEWMTYVEENTVCDECDRQPSTFLYVFPKSKEYDSLASHLFGFLYSPNYIGRLVIC